MQGSANRLGKSEQASCFTLACVRSCDATLLSTLEIQQRTTEMQSAMPGAGLTGLGYLGDHTASRRCGSNRDEQDGVGNKDESRVCVDEQARLF